MRIIILRSGITSWHLYCYDGMPTLKIKRVYESFDKHDGYRVLVDRIWPRGLKKEASRIDRWMKEVSPSTSLRKWFNHEPGKWKEFTNSYREELKKSDAVTELKEIIKEYKTVTLLYSAKDEKHNQAVVLQQFVRSLIE